MAWDAAFESLRAECGCRASMNAALIFVSMLAICSVADSHSTAYTDVVFYAAGILIGVPLSAVVGKFVGRQLARYRYARICRRLLDRLTPTDDSVERMGGAGEGSSIRASVAAVK